MLFLALLAGSASFAQKRDEEKKSYNSFKRRASPEEIGRLLAVAKSVKDTDPGLALENVKEALALSISSQNTLAQARCYNLLGDINMSIQEWKLAYENYRSAAAILVSEGTTDRSDLVHSLRGTGNALLNLKSFDPAMDALTQALSIAADPYTRREVQLDLSEVYYQAGRYAEALKVIGSAQPKSKSSNPSLEVREESQRAKIYARLNQTERASRSFNSSQNMLRDAPAAGASRDEAAVRSTKEEISSTLQEQQKYDDEIVLRNQSIDYNLETNNAAELSNDKISLGKALIAKGESGAALRELKEAAYIADTIGDPRRQANAYRSLGDLYYQRGETREAVDIYRKYSDAVQRYEKMNEQRLIEKAELIKTQRDIEELSKVVEIGKQEESLTRAIVSRQKLIIYGLLLIILIVAVTSWVIYRNAMKSKRANLMLALKSLRTQMNPHFIFNALNSVNHFISGNDERTANRYLAEFSRLMRLVLENSQLDFIPLSTEEEIIGLYLKLEQYRFRDKFDYEIVIDQGINREGIEIPPMLIQPYIENAVWHGLRYRDTRGFLSVRFSSGDGVLVVEVADNGIGRKRSMELKTINQRKHQSTGLKNMEERLKIINEVYKLNYRVTIEDLPDNAGTVVKLFIPVFEKSLVYA